MNGGGEMVADKPKMLFARVYGVPAPKGSKSFKGMFKDKAGRMRARLVESSAKVAPWSDAVAAGVIGDDGRPLATFDGGCKLTLEFIMPRNKTAPKTYTPLHTVKPDMDKLVRCVKDALTVAGVWRDDAQACEYGVILKRFAEVGEPSGCMIIVEEVPQPEKGKSHGTTEASTRRGDCSRNKRSQIDTAGGAMFFA